MRIVRELFLPVQGVWASASDTGEKSTSFRDVKCGLVPFHISLKTVLYRELAIQKRPYPARSSGISQERLVTEKIPLLFCLRAQFKTSFDITEIKPNRMSRFLRV